jgi:hypothetical protein
MAMDRGTVDGDITKVDITNADIFSGDVGGGIITSGARIRYGVLRKC